MYGGGKEQNKRSNRVVVRLALCLVVLGSAAIAVGAVQPRRHRKNMAHDLNGAISQ